MEALVWNDLLACFDDLKIDYRRAKFHLVTIPCRGAGIQDLHPPLQWYDRSTARMESSACDLRRPG